MYQYEYMDEQHILADRIIGLAKKHPNTFWMRWDGKPDIAIKDNWVRFHIHEGDTRGQFIQIYADDYSLIILSKNRKWRCHKAAEGYKVITSIIAEFLRG